MNIQQIYNTEALATLREMKDKSIDCIVTDPPYFKVVDKDWDKGWSTSLEFINWLELICIEFKRVLKENGSIYLFCGNKMNAEVQVMMSKNFNILNNIVWDKGITRAGGQCVEDMRSFFDTSERIIFAEQKDSDRKSGYDGACIDESKFLYKDIVNYLESERKKAGVSRKKVDDYIGTKNMASKHYFSHGQWRMMSKERYEKVQELFNLNIDPKKFLLKDYDILRKDYEELRKQFNKIKVIHKSKRRTFKAHNIWKCIAVWRYDIVKITKKDRHICEKPADLIQHIIMTSTNENDVVLDAFCGSGVVGEVCKLTNRSFTGIELDYKWACIAEDRIKAIS